MARAVCIDPSGRLHRPNRLQEVPSALLKHHHLAESPGFVSWYGIVADFTEIHCDNANDLLEELSDFELQL